MYVSHIPTVSLLYVYLKIVDYVNRYSLIPKLRVHYPFWDVSK